MNTDEHRFNPEELLLKDGKNITAKYKEITHEILASAFEVINTHGAGFLEKIYEKSLIKELTLRGIDVESQKPFNVDYKGETVGDYIADLVIEGKIIVEVKVAEKLTKAHEAQLLNYLHASGLEVGLLLNFGHNKLEYKRLVY